MTDTTFERTVELERDQGAVFEWHRRPGAFERLVPPWEDVRMVGQPAPIEAGAEQVVSVGIGPVRMPWRSRISAVVDGHSFRDVQLAGPFSKWEHTHSMRATRPQGAVLEDSVRYVLPLGWLGRAVAGRSVEKRLERMFAYRHRVTAQDLAWHGTTQRTLDVLVTGASGMVGKALCAFLSTGGHRVRRLVRRKPSGPDEFRWDPLTGDLDPRAVEGTDAVVHLAGENIAGRRWTRLQKQRIRQSRTQGTRQVADAIRAAKNKPGVLVSAAAIGIYGDRGDEWLDESSSKGTGFLADVCAAWEREALNLTGCRTVQLRFGVVLSPSGGALKKMLLPFLMGGGGRIGSGKQWMSWVALDDVLGAIHHALVTESLKGPVNVVAPSPVTNADYTRTLGRVLRRPTIVPMPGFVARAAFGELADELLLASQRVRPTKLEESGYRFAQPELEGALRHQLGRTVG